MRRWRGRGCRAGSGRGGTPTRRLRARMIRMARGGWAYWKHHRGISVPGGQDGLLRRAVRAGRVFRSAGRLPGRRWMWGDAIKGGMEASGPFPFGNQRKEPGRSWSPSAGPSPSPGRGRPGDGPRGAADRGRTGAFLQDPDAEIRNTVEGAGSQGPGGSSHKISPPTMARGWSPSVAKRGASGSCWRARVQARTTIKVVAGQGIGDGAAWPRWAQGFPPAPA